MMETAKLLTREEFRTKVFERDHYRCVFCKADAVDAHHIMERRLWADGGYYLENGASVCTPCHILCEKTYYSTADVRKATGITRILLPDHFYDDQEFDKWGNPVMPNGQRLRGELFYDGSVQKILADYLHLFTKYIKYPRTFHLPWSDGMHDDDRMMPDVKIFEGKRVIVMEKMDGECLLASTKITMSDFSKINIRDIYKNKIIGQHVLGVNQRGEIVPSKILNVFFNGVTEEWLSVNVKGQYGPYVKINCTPNHKFNVNDNYIEAKNMKGGDMVKIIDYSPPKVEHNISVPRLREVEVKSVEKYLHNTNRGKYDIETETHNYFANGVLVHNCTTMYNDYIHARSIDSGSHGSRNWIKAFHGQLCANIPEDWRINVENLYAKHSIFYNDLETYAYGFALWNEKNYLLDWTTSLEWFELLGITPCPWFYWDTYDRKKIHSLYEELSKDHETEGYVIRVDEPFHYGQFRTHVGKFVRKGHIQTTKHWAYGQKIEPNSLKEGVTGFEALL